MLIEVDVYHVQNIAEAVLNDLDYSLMIKREWEAAKEKGNRTLAKEKYKWYKMANDKVEAAWEIMAYACSAMNIDEEKLIAATKAMNRQSKKNNWKCYNLKDKQIGGLLKDGSTFKRLWSKDVAYKVERVLP